MKKIFIALLLSCFLMTNTLVAEDAKLPFKNLEIRNDSEILFLGDSITQSGRYIAFLQLYLWDQFPENQIKILNLGLGAETASGNNEPDHPYPRPNIHSRVDRILKAVDSDVVFICYGMNDGIYHPLAEKRFDDFKNGIRSLVKKVKRPNRQIVLMTPPTIDMRTKKIRKTIYNGENPNYGFQNTAPDYDAVLTAYSNWIKAEMNQEVDLIIDVNSLMINFLLAQRKINPSYLYKDGVHPPMEGHLAMALGIIDAIGGEKKSAQMRLEKLTGVPLHPAASNKYKSMEVWNLTQKRHSVLTNAWLEKIGHTKPKKMKALPLDEANSKAESYEKKIRRLLRK